MALAGVTASNILNLLYILGGTAIKAFLTTTSLHIYTALGGAVVASLGVSIFMREARKEPPPPLFSWRVRRESFL